ncbi:hypothetical protein SBDP1_1600003 [Syntrophobacter sp. SbD1]|nr:hypothetical protein SBDP1_1600003 [Syntrophobacter sp. SbD1]
MNFYEHGIQNGRKTVKFKEFGKVLSKFGTASPRYAEITEKKLCGTVFTGLI